MKKFVPIYLIFCFVTLNVSAQLSNLQFGGGSTYTYYGGDVSDESFGVQLLGNICLDKKFAVVASYSFGFPSHKIEKIGTTTSDTKFNFNAFNLSMLIYVKSNIDDDFSMYVPIGVSGVSGKFTRGYKSSSSSSYKELNVKDIAFTMGFGAQYRLGVPIIFTEVKVAFPINPENNINSPVLAGAQINDVPFHSFITVGLKYEIVQDFRKRRERY